MSSIAQAQKIEALERKVALINPLMLRMEHLEGQVKELLAQREDLVQRLDEITAQLERQGKELQGLGKAKGR